MKVVFDTNIIIDAVASREPFCQDAEALLLMASEKAIAGFITANCVADVFYVIRRILAEDAARDIIRSILFSLDIIEVNGSDCWKALDLSMEDYEDALMVCCSEKIGADCIISRDDKLLKKATPVKIVLPFDFLTGNSAPG